MVLKLPLVKSATIKGVMLCCLFIIIFLFVTAICMPTEAQTTVMMLPEGNRTKTKDSIYILKLIQQGNKIQSTSLDSAKHFFSEAIQLCGNNRYPTLKSLAYRDLASVYYHAGEFDSCILFCNKAIPIEKDLRRGKSLLYLYEKLAFAYISKDAIHLAMVANQEALDWIHKNENLQKTVEAANIYEQRARLWSLLREPEQGLPYLDSAERVSRFLKDTIAMTSNLIAKAKLIMDFTERTDAFLKALHLARQTGNKGQQVACLVYLGADASMAGKTKDGFLYFNKALKIRDKVDYIVGLKLVPEFYIARAYYKDKQYQLAEHCLKEIIVRAEATQNKSVLRESYELLSDIYAATNQYQEAYKNTKLYQGLVDSTIKMEKEKTVEFLIQYQSLEKDKKLTQKELLITRQQKDLQAKNFWIGGISFGLLLSGALLLTLVRVYRHKQNLQTATIVNLTQQQKIDQLQTIMQSEERERNRIARELHDGVGSQMAAARMHLDVFKKGYPVPDYAKTYKKGLQLLDDAYKGLRYTAHNLLPGQMLQRGLVPVLQEYCQKISRPDLLAIRFQSFGVIPDLAADKALSIYRMVQELIHNALKHAAATNIVVELGIEEQHLFVTVEDNGSGWDTTAEEAGSGIGLTNLKERVEVLKGVLEIDSRQGVGTTIYMNLPLNEIVT